MLVNFPKSNSHNPTLTSLSISFQILLWCGKTAGVLRKKKTLQRKRLICFSNHEYNENRRVSANENTRAISWHCEGGYNVFFYVIQKFKKIFFHRISKGSRLTIIFSCVTFFHFSSFYFYFYFFFWRMKNSVGMSVFVRRAFLSAESLSS